MIDEPTLPIEGLEDRVKHVAQVADARRVSREPRHDRLTIAQVSAQPPERAPRGRDRDQLGGLERRSLSDALDRSGDLEDSHKR
jgi:hypothetical protein